MIMEPDGRILFEELCKRLNELKFVTDVGQSNSGIERSYYIYDDGEVNERV